MHKRIAVSAGAHADDFTTYTRGAVRTRWVVENQDGRGDFMSIGKGVEGCGKGGRAWREEVSRKTSHRMTAFNQSLGSGGHVS